MKRAVIMVVLAVICTAATTTPHAKGIRAIIVYGTAGEGSQVVAEKEAATELYIRYVRAMTSRAGDQLPHEKIRSRPCLRIAVFMDNAATRGLEATDLNPALASLTYWYYPALNGEPAVDQAGRVMTAETAELLPRYNEEFLKRAEYPRCDTRI